MHFPPEQYQPAEQAPWRATREITSMLLLEHGAKLTNLLTAGVGPVELNSVRRDGASTRDFGFDALSLLRPLFAHQASLAPSRRRKAAFVVAPADAGSLSRAREARIPKISVAEMLAACAGADRGARGSQAASGRDWP